MKKIKINTLIALLGFLLCGCFSSAYYVELLQLRIGMPLGQAKEIIASCGEIDDFLGEENDYFDISKKVGNGSKYTVLLKLKENIISESYYVFAFENDKLLYWDYPSNMIKSDREVIEKIGVASAEIIEKYKDK